MTKQSPQTNSMTKPEVFSLLNYQIQFSCVYEIPEIQSAFRKHLQQEMNTEPFDFCLAIRNLSNKIDKKEFPALVKDLIVFFVDVNGKREVNMSAEIRNDIQSKYLLFQQGNLTNQEYYDSISKVIPIVNNEMKVDNFPRFIRSNAFLALASNNSLNETVMIPRILKDFPFTEQDFQIPCITKKDVAFARYLLDDFFDWNLDYSRNGCNGYSTEMEMFSQVPWMRDMSVLKMQMVLPYSFDCCILVNSDYENLRLVNKNIEKVQIERIVSLEEVEKESHGLEVWPSPCIVHTTFTNLFYPLNMRRVEQVSTGLKYDDDTVAIVMKPYYDPKISKRIPFFERGKGEYEVDGKKIVKEMYQVPCLSSIHFEKVDENKTLFTSVVFINSGGWTGGKKLRKVLNRTVLETMVRDMYKKYEILTSKKIPGDTKFDQGWKDRMLQSPQGKLMHFALFEQNK